MRIIEAVGIVSHEVVVSTATPDAWIAVFCAVAKRVDFAAHRDAIKKKWRMRLKKGRYHRSKPVEHSGANVEAYVPEA